MSHKRTNPRRTAPPPRTARIHATFSPDSPSGTAGNPFWGFFTAALQGLERAEKTEREKAKAHLAKLKAADRKAWPVMREFLRDQTSTEAAAQELKNLVSDKDLMREIFDCWRKAAKATPEQVARREEDIARRQAELAKEGRLVQAGESFQGSLTAVSQAVSDGSDEAAEALADFAVQAALHLFAAEVSKPDLLRRVARLRPAWPVFATVRPNWEKTATQRTAALGLGAGLRQLQVHLRQPRGTDANLPARRWAKAALRTIEQTKLNILVLGGLVQRFGSPDAFVDSCAEAGWELTEMPEWARQTPALKNFSRESLPAWKAVVRRMIGEQIPDFHLSPEWANYRRRKYQGGAKRGVIQHAIFKDILSAMRTIAGPSRPPTAPRPVTH